MPLAWRRRPPRFCGFLLCIHPLVVSLVKLTESVYKQAKRFCHLPMPVKGTTMIAMAMMAKSRDSHLVGFPGAPPTLSSTVCCPSSGNGAGWQRCIDFRACPAGSRTSSHTSVKASVTFAMAGADDPRWHAASPWMKRSRSTMKRSQQLRKQHEEPVSRQGHRRGAHCVGILFSLFVLVCPVAKQLPKRRVFQVES